MTDLLLPYVDDDSGPFWEGTGIGELRVRACGDCDLVRFPPRPMCPVCQSTASEWIAVAGTGAVWSFVVPHPPLLPAYAALAPYNVIVVDVALGDPPLPAIAPVRIVGNLVTRPDGPINEVDPATIEIGMPVEVVFPPPIDGFVLPRWVSRRP